MASGVPILSLWTDLQAAGGTRVGYLRLWSNGKTTLREDGDDRFTFTLDRTDGLIASVLVGYAVRAEYLDAEVEEWIIERTTDRWPSDTLDVECAGARVWLAERVLIYTEAGATGTSAFTSTGTATEILTALAATTNWPSWVTTGTIDATDECTLTLSSATGLSAIVGLRDAVNAVRAVASDPVVFRFRRVSGASWVIDLITGATAGAVIASGKNLVGMAVQRDRTQQATALAPVGAGNVMAEEALFRIRYQQAPSGGMIELGIEALDGKATIVLEDNQFNGQYLVDSAGTIMQILDTQYVAICSKVWVADSHTVVAPGTCRLARNSSGDPLLTFPWPSAPSPARVGFLTDTTKARKMNWVFIPGMDQYDSGILRGWTETIDSGTAAFAVESTTFETGASGRSYSVASGTAAHTAHTIGGSTGYIDGAYRAGTWTIGCRVYSSNSASSSSRDVYFTHIKANGVSQTALTGTTSANWTGTTSSWQTIEFTFAMTGTADTTFEIRLDFNLGASAGSSAKKIVVDRVWLFRTGIDDGDDTLYGSQMTDLIFNANRQLRATGGDAPASYVVQVADLYRDNPTGYPNDALAPYTTARLVVPERSVDETLRVVSVSRQLDAPLSATLQLGAVRGRLTTLI
jgi:hypothetical protein